jgi:hypothetical protein
MFQLRFLIGSPRRLSAHIFCHRNFRGQRTGPDDFHPEFKTFICKPSEGRTSYQLMLELMRHAADHQAGSQLFPIPELYDPETGVRAKLDGTEVILRRSDIDAAQAMMADQLPTATIEANEVEEENPLFNEMSFAQVVEGCGLNIDNVPQESQPPSDTPPEDVPPEGTPETLEQRIIKTLANGGSNKLTAPMLADSLGVDAAVIKTTVAESSRLQNKGGWISTVTAN